MKYIWIILIIKGLTVYSQNDLDFKQLDDIFEERGRQLLIDKKVKSCSRVKHEGDSSVLAFAGLLYISKSGEKFQEMELDFPGFIYKTTIYKNKKIKKTIQEIDCNGKPKGKRNSYVLNRVIKNDSLNHLVFNWMNNKLNDTIIFYRKINYDSVGIIDMIVEYEFNKKNNVISEKIIYPAKPDYLHVKKIYFNNSGKIEKREFLSSKHYIVAEYKYDEYDNEVEKKVFRDNILKSIFNTTYNSKNLPIQEIYFELPQNKKIYYLYKYTYYK
jgi:hypothetical protein